MLKLPYVGEGKLLKLNVKAEQFKNISKVKYDNR